MASFLERISATSNAKGAGSTYMPLAEPTNRSSGRAENVGIKQEQQAQKTSKWQQTMDVIDDILGIKKPSVQPDTHSNVPSSASSGLTTDAAREEKFGRFSSEPKPKTEDELRKELEETQSQLEHEIALSGLATSAEQGAEQGQKIQSLRQQEKQLKQQLGEPTDKDRAANFISGLLKSNAAAATGGQRLLYEAGQGARSAYNEELYNQAKADYENRLRAYNETVAEFGEENAWVEKNLLDAAKRNLDAYGAADEAQRKATKEAADFANALQYGSQQDYEATKEGLGAVGRLAVDAGAAAGDILIDAATGVPMVNMAARAFGNAAIEANNAGATIDKQLEYAAAQAGKSAILNKLVGGLGKVYGKSKLSSVTDKLWDKAAKNPATANALKAVLNTEGAEEFLEAAIDPAMRTIYSGQTAKEEYSEEQLADWLYSALVGQILGTGFTGVEVATRDNTNLNAQMPKSENGPQSVSESVGDIQSPPSTPNASTNAPDVLNSGTQPQSPIDIVMEVATGQKNAAPTQGTDSTAVNTDPRQHTPVEQAVINEYQNAVDDNLVNYIETVRDNPNAKIGRYTLKPVSAQAAAKIKELTGIEVSGNKTQIEPRIIEHIINRHGKNGKANKSMSDVNDIARIQYVIDNYDSISHGGSTKAYQTVKPNGKAGQAQTVVFSKAVNGTYYVVEAVPDTKAKTLFVVSAYMEKKRTGAAQTADADASRVTSETKNVQSPVIEAEASNPYIAQNAAAVNGAGYGQGRERVRGYETNVASSKVTDPELAVRVERDLNTYKQLGNADTLKKAQSIMLQGLPTAQAELQKALGAAKSGAKLSPEMVPLSRLVANELTRNGDVETARQIIADVAVELTAAGQLGQAGRIMRTADPATALDSIRKALDKINTEFSQRMPNSQWMAELTAEEEQLIANTDFTQDGAFEQVYDQIARRIGAEMPVSMWNKLTELRRINMLLRPRSLIKNVVSNVPMKGLRKGAENLSAAIQRALPSELRTRGFASDEQKVIAREYYTEHEKEILEQGDRWDINSLIRKYKTVFKGKNENKLTKELSKLSDKEVENVMEGLRQLTYTALEKGDARFVRSAFVDSLSQYMAAQGINSANGITQEAVDFAMANALEATFKSANVVATALNTIKRNASPATAMALDVLFPFTTTPTNILIQTGKYSPVGLVSGVVNMVTQGANASNIDALSKGAVGSALIALGWALRSMDIITGGEDEDKDKAALDKATGNNTYSIGGKVSYDWAQPVGSLLALGAEISDAVSEQESWASAFVNALYTAGDSVLNMSLFQNVLSVLKGSGATKNIFDTIMEGGAIQLIPGLAGDIARIIDGTVRSTYTGGNVFNDAAAKMQANIPFASKNLPASINVKGEANTRGGLLERTVNTLANPANVSQGKRTAADEEIYRILEETGSKTHFPSVSPYSVEFDGEKFKMNGEERAQFQTTQGQAYYSVVDELIQNAVYKNADVDVQRKILETVRDYSLAAAKSQFLEGKDKEYTWPNKTIENASILEDPATYLAALATMKASQEKTGGTFDSNSADVFKGYITAGLNNDDLSTLSENLSSTNKESYDTLTAQFGQDEANRIFTQVQTKDIYGDQTSAVEKGSQINVIPGLSDAQKVAVLEAYTPPDKDTGKRKTAVLGYEAALNNDISFSQWTGILEELDEYDETQGNNNGQYNKAEFSGALGYGALDQLGVDMGWWNVRNLYNNAAEMTDAYNESAIEPKKPKVPSRAFRYDPKGIYKILGLG